MLFFLMSAAFTAHAADDNVEDQFNELVARGKAQLALGRLTEAAAQFRAAAGLKPAPSILLRLISVYGDIAKVAEDPTGHQCEAVQLTLRQLFASCDRCTGAVQATRECRPCLIMPSRKSTMLAVRTAALARSLTERSRHLAEEARTGPSQTKERTQRRSRGLAAAARDVQRCLSEISVVSTPAGATVRIDGEHVGTTPVQRPAFAGKHSVAVSLADGRARSQQVALSHGAKHSVTFDLGLSDKPAPVPARSTQASVIPSDRHVEDILKPDMKPNTYEAVAQWSMIGTGAVLTGLGFYLVQAAISDEQRTLEPGRTRFDEYESAMDDHRSKHTVGLTTAIIGSALAAGGAVWMLATPSPKRISRVSSPRIKVMASPAMINLGGVW